MDIRSYECGGFLFISPTVNNQQRATKILYKRSNCIEAYEKMTDFFLDELIS